MKLVELARTVRSKNAGPLKLTLDLLFDDEAAYRRALQSPALEPGAVARLYGRPEGTVQVLPYPLKVRIGGVVPAVIPKPPLQLIEFLPESIFIDCSGPENDASQFNVISMLRGKAGNGAVHQLHLFLL